MRGTKLGMLGVRISPVSSYALYSTLSAIQVALSVVALVLLIRAREFRTYWPMLYITNWQTIPFFTWLSVRHFGPVYHLPPKTAYAIYFFSFWPSFALQAIFAVVLTYLILREAMRPLKGLLKLSNIIYWWIAGVSTVLALTAGNAARIQGNDIVIGVVSEMQRTSGTLTLGLMLFVCIAIRPMGLSLRSRVFGVSIGILILSLMNTLQSSYVGQPKNLYAPYAIVQIATNCVAEGVWIWYFAVPEPKRKFVLLSTKSPFHHWNQIAEQFGAEPGFVAIGGIPPDAFAAAEIEIFHRASAKMNALTDSTDSSALPPGGNS